MRARDSDRLASRGPAHAESDAGPSLRLRVLAAYFTVCGTVALLVASISAVLAARGSPDAASLGPHPRLVLMILFISGAAWLLTGWLLARRRRLGALLALVALAVPAAQWISGAPFEIETLVVIIVGTAIILTTWRELRA